MKQSKQPRPGTGRVVRTLRPAPETRPAKPPMADSSVADSPDAARSVPTATGGDRPVKGDNGTPRAAQSGPTKAPFAGPGPERSSTEQAQTEQAQTEQAPETSYPEQQPRREASAGSGAEALRHDEVRAGGESQQQYVRLRIRVRGDSLSVVDSHLVDGPLGQVTGFPGGNAYEVTLDGRLLHAGALPDLGVQRSFPNPAGPQLQRGHFVTERDAFEFMARVPAEELTPETLGRVRVSLHRVTDEARAQRLGPEPLAQQFQREMRPVAELDGLPESALPAAIEARGGRTPSV